MKQIIFTKEILEIEYLQKKKSPYQIAKEYGTYPTLVRKYLQEYNIKIRNKSEAQKAAQATGSAKHPTKGKPRSQKVKEKIGASLMNRYKKLSEEERNKLVENGKKSWLMKTDEEKKRLIEKRQKGLDKVKKSGTKLERSIMESLIGAGYKVTFHKKNILAQEELELDLFLPEDGICIEIDGPTHYLPIYGEDRLQREKEADARKNGLLLDAGYVVIRIMYLANYSSPSALKAFSDNLLKLITEIVVDFPTKREDRLIYLDFGGKHNE